MLLLNNYYLLTDYSLQTLGSLVTSLSQDGWGGHGPPDPPGSYVYGMGERVSIEYPGAAWSSAAEG